MTVLVDTHVVNVCGLGVLILKACEELGVKCETRQLATPFTVSWVRSVSSTRLDENMKVGVSVETWMIVEGYNGY